MKTDAEIYGNPDKTYKVMFLRTNKSAGHYKSLKEALKKKANVEEHKHGYATIIRVDPITLKPLYGRDGYPMPL
jgi:hypothetical protein